MKKKFITLGPDIVFCGVLSGSTLFVNNPALLDTTPGSQMDLAEVKDKYSEKLLCPNILGIQSNLVISNSLISNYRLSRSENLVPVLTWNYENR